MASKKKDRLHLGKINFIMLGVAALLIIIAYVIMAANDITISPIILSLVWVGLIPLALLYKAKPKD
jgi:hypothetical protein